jgi:hypothetical protein
MSSSCRSVSMRYAATLIAAAALLGPGRPAWTQEIDIVPFAAAMTEWDSNRSLRRPPASAHTYGGSVGVELRDLTPRSYTDLVSQISYDKVPQLGYAWYSGSVNLNTDYRTAKGDYSLLAGYRRQDSFYTEFGHAAFNDVTPTSPDTTATTAVTTGITRQSYEVDPGFVYQLSPRLELNGDLDVNSTRYSVEAAGRYVNYTSPYIGVFLDWAMGPRSSVGIGPYYTHYEQTDLGTNTTNTDGIGFTYHYKTSDVTRMSLVLRVERDQINVPNFGGESATTWGLEWVGTHKYRVGNVQFSIGRFLEPSSIGSRVALDQFRAQYNRPLSAKLFFSGALRVTRSQLIGSQLAETPLERTNAEMYLRMELTPTWYLTGGYIFARARDVGVSNLAYSNGVSLTIGYRGIERPRPVDR